MKAMTAVSRHVSDKVSSFRDSVRCVTKGLNNSRPTVNKYIVSNQFVERYVSALNAVVHMSLSHVRKRKTISRIERNQRSLNCKTDDT